MKTRRKIIAVFVHEGVGRGAKFEEGTRVKGKALLHRE